MIHVKFDEFAKLAKKLNEKGISILGAQVQYRVPGGTCDMYWRTVDLSEKKLLESRKNFLKRNLSEAISSIETNFLSKVNEIDKDAIESFKFLEESVKKGVNIRDYRVLEVYVE